MASVSLATFILILFSLSGSSGTAKNDGRRKGYIVHILKSMKPQHFTSHHHWYASMLDQVVHSDPTANEMLYTYDTLLRGFAARLSKAEAQAMEAMDGCLAVIPSHLNKIATTHTPEFLSLSSPSGLWSRSYGKDIIVGMIDTGVWPESKSFSDAGLGPVPSRWKGTCESGRAFDSSNCNGKIIGARYFYKGYEAQNPTPINETLEYKSPRDNDGHGTHTASTVAGAAVPRVSYFGFANGTARGMAPEARLAIYKACWEDGCYDADTVAAMEQAIADGVDVISISIGSQDRAFYEDNRAIAAFGAVQKGVFVSASAGNNGPYSSTLGNVAPWIVTVGASSIDRDFPVSVVLGNREIYGGSSAYSRADDATLHGPLPLVYVSTNFSTSYCLAGSLDPDLVKGKIVVCDQISSYIVEVWRAGGAGIIGANDMRYGLEQRVTNPNTLPAISVSFTTGEKITAYVNSSRSNATATMSLKGLTISEKVITAPIVADFSSRGPSRGYPLVLKPDIIAPGLNILAAYKEELPYNILSGTSMSCPHISGIAAPVKAIHPTWSHAAIKSALMTSSYLIDNTGQPIKDSYTMRAADPFVLGAGHVDPNKAVDPGLVYDMTPQDYITFLCSLNYKEQQIALLTKGPVSCPNSSLEAGDLNYPSFSVVMKSGSKSVQVKRRIVKYVGAGVDAVYQVNVKDPAGITISVEPKTLKFKKLLDTASYSVKFESTVASSGYRFGEIMWNCTQGGSQIVRSPVAVIIEA